MEDDGFKFQIGDLVTHRACEPHTYGGYTRVHGVITARFLDMDAPDRLKKKYVVRLPLHLAGGREGLPLVDECELEVFTPKEEK